MRIRTWTCRILFIGLGIGLIGGAFYGFLIEPNLLAINHFRIEDHGLSPALRGRTAVLLSDLHIGRVGERERKVLRILDQLKPDVIFLTGDYVKWGGDYEGALTFLSALNAPIGVFAVMGDYDYSNSRKSCLFCHEPGTGRPATRHSVKFLRHSVQRLRLEGGDLQIWGVDYEEEDSSDTSDRMHFRGGGVEAPAIVLSHSPLEFDQIDEREDVLILAGDTHGGQAPLPSWAWKILGYEKTARFSHGFFEKGRKRMYVSKGIGTSHIPIRFFRRPEVAVFHFE